MEMVMLIAAAGIAALACQFGFKMGQAVYQELYLCGSFC